MHTRIPDKGVIENEVKLRAKQTVITYSIGDRRFYKEDGGSFFWKGAVRFSSQQIYRTKP
jgi:hypothetical protein